VTSFLEKEGDSARDNPPFCLAAVASALRNYALAVLTEQEERSWFRFRYRVCLHPEEFGLFARSVASLEVDLRPEPGHPLSAPILPRPHIALVTTQIHESQIALMYPLIVPSQDLVDLAKGKHSPLRLSSGGISGRQLIHKFVKPVKLRQRTHRHDRALEKATTLSGLKGGRCLTGIGLRGRTFAP